MAKRENFEIRLNGELLATKHAWNASRREVENLVKLVAQQRESLAYNQGMTGIEKDSYGNHVKGCYVWLCAGMIFNYSIEKV